MRFIGFLVAATLLGCQVEDADTDTQEPDCEEGIFQCDGDILQLCDPSEGWVTEEDCSESDMMCHADMGHCM